MVMFTSRICRLEVKSLDKRRRNEARRGITRTLKPGAAKDDNTEGGRGFSAMR